MSTTPRMSLIGMYNFDHTLFDNLSLPEGYDNATFIDSFLLEHGEKCVLYPQPEFMKFSIGAISRKWALELEKIYEALTAEYNPTYNYDRHEEFTDSTGTTHGEKVTTDLKNERTADLLNTTTYDSTDTLAHDTTDTRTQTIDGTTEHKVSAFNSSNYEESEKNITNDGTTTLDRDGSDTTTRSGSDSVATTGTDTYATSGTMEEHSGTDYVNSTHEAHLYGNIGVTTATAMVNEILDQRFTKNLYSIAGRIFANELLIQIY